MESIHIGYGDSAAKCIEEAMSLHGLEGDRVVPSRDDLTQGPIANLGMIADGNQRISYWQDIHDQIAIEIDAQSIYTSTMDVLDSINNCEVILWQGDSCHDILATAWILMYLSDRNISWSIIDLSHYTLEQRLPPVNIAMFSPELLTELYRQKQSIDRAALVMYGDLWKQMQIENTVYRIMVDHQIISVGETYYDEYILNHCSSEWEVACSILGKVMKSANHTLSDTTILFRIRKLIQLERLYYRGKLVDAKEFELRLVSTI